MAIDDKLSQAKAQVESDERQRNVGSQVAEELLRLCNSIPVLKKLVPVIEPLQAILEMFQRHRLENVKYLVDVIIECVKEQEAKLGKLSESHRRFIEDEWPNLVLDGVAKALQARAKQRVKRLGEILAHAYVKGQMHLADMTEEMMRVAMGLDDDDVTVLAWLCGGMRSTYVRGSGSINFEIANDFWHEVEDRIKRGYGGGPELPKSMKIGQVMTCCAKLQAFGLVLQVRQNPAKTFETLPYSPLDRGYEFLEYLRSNG